MNHDRFGPDSGTCGSTSSFASILTFRLCAKSLNPPRDLLRLSRKKNLSGSACAVSRVTSRFATDRTRRPETKKTVKSTSTTRKATGEKPVRTIGRVRCRTHVRSVFFNQSVGRRCWCASFKVSRRPGQKSHRNAARGALHHRERGSRPIQLLWDARDSDHLYDDLNLYPGRLTDLRLFLPLRIRVLSIRIAFRANSVQRTTMS
jgi:hypothetical protein